MDCYGSDEQASGLTEMAMQELDFPFAAMVLGETVQVVDAQCPTQVPPVYPTPQHQSRFQFQLCIQWV